MASIGAWKNRLHKFIDYPPAIVPFLLKHFYLNYIADKYLPLYKDFKFLNYQDTIDEIIDKQKSIIRFGDEAIDMTLGIGLYYDNWHQKYEKKLAERYKEVLAASHPRLLVGLHWEFFTKTKKQLEEINIPAQIWTHSKVYLHKYLDKSNVYGAALAFQPKYNQHIDYEKVRDYFKTKHIVIVTGRIERFKHIKLGKTTDLLPCPTNDVWSMYDKLYADILQLVKNKGYDKKDTLFLISLACTAKVMVYDLTLEGYQAWDTGQFFDLAFREIENIVS